MYFSLMLPVLSSGLFGESVNMVISRFREVQRLGSSSPHSATKEKAGHKNGHCDQK